MFQFRKMRELRVTTLTSNVVDQTVSKALTLAVNKDKGFII